MGPFGRAQAADAVLKTFETGLTEWNKWAVRGERLRHELNGLMHLAKTKRPADWQEQVDAVALSLHEISIKLRHLERAMFREMFRTVKGKDAPRPPR